MYICMYVYVHIYISMHVRMHLCVRICRPHKYIVLTLWSCSSSSVALQYSCCCMLKYLFIPPTCSLLHLSQQKSTEKILLRYEYTSLSKRDKGGNVPFLCKKKTTAAKKIRELKCCGPGAPWLPGMYRELLICFPAVIASIAVWLSIGLAVWRLIQTTKQTNKRWPTRQDALFSALAVACGRPDTVRIGPATLST